MGPWDPYSHGTRAPTGPCPPCDPPRHLTPSPPPAPPWSGSELVKLLTKSGKPYDYTLDEKTGLVAEIGYKA